MKIVIAIATVALVLAGCSADSTDSAASSAAQEAETAANAAEAAAVQSTEPRQLTSEEKRQGEKAVALLLNLNQLLCAEVVEVNPLKVRPGVLEVKCIEYRGGTATKNYIVDTNDGTAFAQ